MKRGRLNRAQRVVVVVALGFALYILGAWITSIGSHLPYGSATFTNLSSSTVEGGLHPWVQFTIWMLLVTVWVSASILLLKDCSVNHEGR
jgi:hypothetical protein